MRPTDLRLTWMLAIVAILASGCAWIARVSVDSEGNEGTVFVPVAPTSDSAAMSADGRYVAFASVSPDLVPDDTNGKRDVFVHDTTTGSITRVSVDSTGTQAEGDSGGPALSADGRFVVFGSAASNLVAGDTNGWEDVFLHDTVNGTTTRVSVDSTGAQSNGPSGPAVPGAFFPTGWLAPDISADGRYVAFPSSATNLVAGDTNGAQDIFVHDTATGSTTRVSVDSAGNQATCGSAGPACSTAGSYGVAISDDATRIAFQSTTTNLVSGDTNGSADVFLHDTTAGSTTRVSVDSSGAQAVGGALAQLARVSISGDGRFVSFASSATNLVGDDTNGKGDAFVHDTSTGTTTRVSLDNAGNQVAQGGGSPVISGDGRFVAFTSSTPDLVAGDTNGAVDVYVHETVSGATTRVSVDSSGVGGDGGSTAPAISADGTRIAFESDATNLVAGDANDATDVFLHETTTSATERMSPDLSGGPYGFFAPAGGTDPAVSSDAGRVAFTSLASNLVAGDTNDERDVFVRHNATGAVTRVSVDSAGAEGDGVSSAPSISGDGTRIAFTSSATNLVTGDANGANDVFVHDTTTGATTRASVDSSGVEGGGTSTAPAISADGRFVTFESAAPNLVADDTNGVNDVFVHDTVTGATTRVSVDSTGNQVEPALYGPAEAAPSISGDGRFVAFTSAAPNLVAGDTNDLADVYVHDTVTGATRRVSVNSTGNEATCPEDPAFPVDPPAVLCAYFGLTLSSGSSISLDGRYVAFESYADNLVDGDTNFDINNTATDVFVHDTVTGATTRVSVDSVGNQVVRGGNGPSISGDGGLVVFTSPAPDLVAGDANGQPDVFVHDSGTGATTRLSVDRIGSEASGGNGVISGDGRFVAFTSSASNLVSGDTGGTDVFVRAVTTPTMTSVTPATLARGTTTTVTVSGVGFAPGTSAGASGGDPNGITVGSVTVVSDTELELSVTVDAVAATGPRNLTINVAGPGPGNQGIGASIGFCGGCLEVT